MRPRTTRRALLNGVGLATVLGLAGCQLRQVDRTDTPTPRFGQDGQGADGPPSGDSGDGTDGRDTTPVDGGDGQTGTGETPTQTTGRTFSFQITNGITAEDLEPVEGLSTDTTVQLLIDVEARYDDREETVFERTMDLPPDSSRTIDDAFTTIRNGPMYIVRTVIEQFDAATGQISQNRSDAIRFTPGGFGGPSGTTFDIDIIDFGEQDEFTPIVALREAEPQ